MMNMNSFYANHSKCISIWYANGSRGFNVAICDEPWVGIRGQWFLRQRDAITYAKSKFPGVQVWRETRQGDYAKVS